MNKRIICMLTAACISWNGICSIAYADNVFKEEVETINEQNNSTDSAISISYASPAPSDRYRVDILWDDTMEFCYHPADQVWDTENLKWVDAGTDAKGTWTTKDGKEIEGGIPKVHVTLINYSSNAIKAHFYANEKEVTSDMPVAVDDNIYLQLVNSSTVVNKAVAASDPDEKGEPTKAKFVITLGGEPKVALDSDLQTKIPLTCTIEPAGSGSSE